MDLPILIYIYIYIYIKKILVDEQAFQFLFFSMNQSWEFGGGKVRGD